MAFISPSSSYSIIHVWKQTKNKDWYVSLSLPSLPFPLLNFYFMLSLFQVYKLISSTVRPSKNYINIACVHLSKKQTNKKPKKQGPKLCSSFQRLVINVDFWNNDSVDKVWKATFYFISMADSSYLFFLAEHQGNNISQGKEVYNEF